MTVKIINSFEVPVGRDDDFMALWTEINQFMRQQPGYRWHQLHRSLSPDAPCRFINVAEFADVESFQAAHGPEFRELHAQPAWMEFPAIPGLFEIVNEHHIDPTYLRQEGSVT